MTMRTMLLAGVAGVLALAAACSPPATQSTSQPGSAPQGGGGPMASSMQPGKYRTTVTILSMNIPGVPTQNINMQPTTTEDCVTATDISDFTQGSMTRANDGETCTQNNMTSGGGHIQGDSVCQGEGGQRTMHITGTYTSNHVEMDITSTGQMPNGAGEMSQHMRMASDRIGECAAGEGAD